MYGGGTMIQKILLLILIPGTVFILATQGASETPADNTLSPYFYIENGDPSIDNFPLKNTDVAVTINGVIADVVVTQQYENNGTRPINARYIFPASTRAAVHGMQMRIGDNLIRAQIKEREKAQQVFDKAKKKGQSASLLKQQRPNVFSMSVANIMPGDRVDIELRYTEILVPESGTYQFVYPTVVGPRYSSDPIAGAPESDMWVKNPYLEQGSDPGTGFTISVHISTGLPLQEAVCTSHKTDLIWKEQSVADIRLSDSEPFGGDRDFILNYRLAGKEIESGLMLYEGEDENFFLLMVQPPERIAPEDIPPREYIFVVDVSGSMNGFPLNTAKKLLKDLIGNLRPAEKFNVILFAGSSKLLSPESLPATKENIASAISLIEHQRGGGGTELRAGLERGFGLPGDESFSRTVLIITDGYISAEKKVFDLIRNNMNTTNVFSFGIGSGVNRYLIEGMARAGQGEPFVVTSPGDARSLGERFRQYVSSPVLTGITVGYDGFQPYDVEPVHIADLFAERPVVLFGKWRGKPEGAITIGGSGGQGQYVKTFSVSETRPQPGNSALRYLWARTRVAVLSDFGFGKQDAEAIREVTSLGLTYNLLTAHTSFVAVEEEVRNPAGDSRDVDQPLPLPNNVSNLAVGGIAAKVPEPDLNILIAALALASLVVWARRKKKGMA